MSDNVYKYKHIELGLCINDNNPALPGHTRCQRCYDRHAENSRRLMYYRKDNNLCVSCGKPLDEMSSKTKCFNCAHDLKRPMEVHIATSQAC